MTPATIKNRPAMPGPEQPIPPPPSTEGAKAGPIDTIALVVTLLFTAGQTTERVVLAAEDLAQLFGLRILVQPRWGEVVVSVEGRPGLEMVPAAPLGVDMGKVLAATTIIERARRGEIAPGDIHAALEAAARLAPASTARFAGMAALGAAALGVIFGDLDIASLLLIAISAGLGALGRRGLARLGGNPFAQPLGAALLAGVVGAVSPHADMAGTQPLIALCPCMVLVPGPHILNGALDLARTRIALGAARLAFAGMIVLVICAGLLLGLSIGGAGLAAAAPAAGVPLPADLLAAGLAVAAYGSFFSMPWRIMPFPIVVGMAAHAVRFVLVTSLGESAEIGAFVACFLVGCIVSPLSDRLNLPFAAVGFSAVVSLMPGYFLFETAGDMIALVSKRGTPGALLGDIVLNGATALVIVLAITFGLIVPRLLIARRRPLSVPHP